MSQVSVGVTVFLFLKWIVGSPYLADQIGELHKVPLTSVREGPSFAIACAFVEPADVVYEAQAAHLGPDCFEGAPADSMLVGNRLQRRQKLVRSPLQFHEDSKEHPLLVFVTRKK